MWVLRDFLIRPPILPFVNLYLYFSQDAFKSKTIFFLLIGEAVLANLLLIVIDGDMKSPRVKCFRSQSTL